MVQALVPSPSDNVTRWSDASRRRIDATRAWQDRDLETLLQLVEAHLKLRFKGRPSHSTIRNYRFYGAVFFQWMWEHCPGLKVTHDLGHLMHVSLMNGHLTPNATKLPESSVACILSAFREAARTMQWCGLWDIDMFRDCRNRYNGDNGARPFSPDEVMRLLKACKSPNDSIMLRLGLDAGLRRSEIIALKWKDVDIEDKSITVRNGKGGRRRVVYIGDGPLLKLLKNKGNPEDNVVRNFWGIDVFKRAGVPWGVHRLRHTCAMDLLALCGSIEAVQKHLGHKSVRTTQIYAKMLSGEYRRAIDHANESRNGGGKSGGEDGHCDISSEPRDGSRHSCCTWTHQRSHSQTDTYGIPAPWAGRHEGGSDCVAWGS